MPEEPRALTIDGSWIEQGGPNRRWQGTAVFADSYALLLTVALPDSIFWAKSRTAGTSLAVSFHLHDLEKDLAKAQVIFRVGDGWSQHAKVVLPRIDYLPPNSFPLSVPVNVWTELFRVDADPPASVGLLAIARASVKMGRTGVWRLLEARADIDPELLPALQAGRHGVLVRKIPCS